MFNRRKFLQTSGAGAATGHWALTDRLRAELFAASQQASTAGKKKRVAVVATVWTYLSHAQHICDRMLVGYPHQGRWHFPDLQVVSLYVDQKPEGGQSLQRADEFGFTVYPTIEQAVCCGGSDLNVDAVVIIGEHGNYPRNNKGQILYPRYEFFQQVVNTFTASGRSVPVFNDKHLSYSFDKAQRMVATSRQMKFPLLAGSSLPVTWRMPEVELPFGCEVEDALMVGVGSSDAMDYHALEAMQCMLERRKGGETGVRSVQMLTGDAVWRSGADGRWSKNLLASALSRSDLILGKTLVDARPQDLVGSGELPRLVKEPAAYFLEYVDGTRATMLMLNGAVGDFTFAARVRGLADIQSTQFHLPPEPNVTYSACLVAKIEEMVLRGIAPYPVERTMLVSGILESCLESRIRENQEIQTPHLQVRYTPPAKSQYCRT